MRLHPLSAVVRGLRRGVVLGSFVLFASGFLAGVVPVGLSRGEVLLLAPFAFLLGAGYQVAYYYRFDYALTADTLDIGSGVVGRTEREIPYRRIQNVDVTRGLVHRVLGVAVLRVETAGGSATEATLDFIDRTEAERLQRELRERRAATRDGPETTAAGEESTAEASEADVADAVEPAGGPATKATGKPVELFSLDERELAVLALTAFKPATILFVLAGAPFVQERLFGWLSRATGAPVDLATVVTSPDLLFLSGATAAVFGIAASWVLSALSAVTEYYGFRLGRQGEDLVYERGLLQRYSGSIPTDKVQRLTLTENAIMRRFGYAGLTVETAGYAPGQGSEGGPQSAVPLARRDRTLSLARDIEPFGEVELSRPPTVARRRYAVRYLLAVLVVTGLLWAVAQAVSGFTLWAVPLALLPAVPVAAHLKWANRGYRAGAEYVVVSTGFWNRKTRIVPYYRLQTVVRSRTVFQRRLGLAHLTVDTATTGGFGGADAVAYDIDDAEARRLADTSRRQLQEGLGVDKVVDPG